MNRNLILYAPNVHNGGGFMLLNALLKSWPAEWRLIGFLDQRARSRLHLPPDSSIHWVQANLISRAWAQVTLNGVAAAEDTVLFFHGLPPAFFLKARIVVYLQNRLYFGKYAVSDHNPRVALRLLYERAISRIFRQRVDAFVVQTPTMAAALRHSLEQWKQTDLPKVLILPFIDQPTVERDATVAPEWDFVYVSDGNAHKNHQRLFQAWRELKREGLTPKLALTLGERDRGLAEQVAGLRREEGLEIDNVGHLSPPEVSRLYQQARALIFPSLSESFGMPLIEASRHGLPIVAGELDYVRDVCVPVQTFDPTSARSIARAVRRFLDVPDPGVSLYSPREFLNRMRDEALERSESSV
ncbi:MAG: glycosyltransferase [Magnetococcales bacterium]|nr:glycosyltransferase [Magnetococcales bacterium]